MPHDRLSDEETMNLFGEVFVNELMPAVEETYRITPDREYRAIGGLSRGAGWAVHLGIANWQLFSKIGAHSPAILNSDPLKMGAALDDIPSDSYPDFFIDAGNRDRPEILKSSAWLGEMLNGRGIPHEWHLFSGFHDEDYWSNNLENYLQWYTGQWDSLQLPHNPR
jgi:enterochelin esterase-like enzyme